MRALASPGPTRRQLLTSRQRRDLWLLRRRHWLYLCGSLGATGLVVLPRNMATSGAFLAVAWPYVLGAMLIVTGLYMLAWASLQREAHRFSARAEEIPDRWGFVSWAVLIAVVWSTVLNHVPLEGIIAMSVGSLVCSALRRLRGPPRVLIEDDRLRVLGGAEAQEIPWDDLMVVESPALLDLADGRWRDSRVMFVSVASGRASVVHVGDIDDAALRPRIARHIPPERWIGGLVAHRLAEGGEG